MRTRNTTKKQILPFHIILLSLVFFLGLMGCRLPNEGAGKQSSQKKWGVKIGERIQSRPAVDSVGTVYFGSSDKHLYAYQANGSFLWKYKAEGQVLSPRVISGDRVVVTTNKGELLVLDRYGKLLLKKDENDHKRKALFGCPPVATKDDIVITGGDLVLVAYQLKTKKQFVLGKSLPLVRSCPVLDKKGRLYFSDKKKLYSWNLKTKKQLWAVPLKSSIAGPVFDEQNNLYVGLIDGKIMSFQSDGKHRWTFVAPKVEDKSKQHFYNFGWPVVTKSGLVLSIRSHVGLFAIDAATGKQKWFFRQPSPLNYHTLRGRISVSKQEVIYVTAGDGHIYALNAKGKVNFKFRADRESYFGGVLSPDEKTVYFGSFDKHFYAIHAEKK